jgi:hypothetical protein
METPLWRIYSMQERLSHRTADDKYYTPATIEQRGYATRLYATAR